MAMVPTREYPSTWYAGIEKSKEKAKKLMGKIVALDQNTSVIIGKLDRIDIDSLWKMNCPYCKLTVKNALRYKIDGNFQQKMEDLNIFFVNKPEMVMSVEEFSKRFPKVYTEVVGKIKTGQFD
jgi:hypothetical protein